MRRRLEVWYPYLIGILAALNYLLYPFSREPENLDVLLASMISISALAVGFIVSARSILLSVGKDNRLMRLVEDKGVKVRLWRYFREALYQNFMAAIASCALLLVNFDPAVGIHHTFFSGWIFIVVSAVFALIRVTQFFLDIVDE